jgi:hypothetical protein
MLRAQPSAGRGRAAASILSDVSVLSETHHAQLTVWQGDRAAAIRSQQHLYMLRFSGCQCPADLSSNMSGLQHHVAWTFTAQGPCGITHMTTSLLVKSCDISLNRFSILTVD